MGIQSFKEDKLSAVDKARYFVLKQKLQGGKSLDYSEYEELRTLEEKLRQIV